MHLMSSTFYIQFVELAHIRCASKSHEMVHGTFHITLGNKVEIVEIKATGSADRDFLVIYSGHG